MQIRQQRLLVFLVHAGLIVSSLNGQSAPNALLPRPQELHYGEGALPVGGLGIRFASTPTAEDRFVAEQLVSGLASKTHGTVQVQKGRGSRPAILLRRTGEEALVPGAKETVGPDCRESYRLRMTRAGAEIQARSSAGLFYGAQTLLQMVEGEGAGAMLPGAEVHDWPALAYRGFMMDFSHGQLLRVAEVERQMDLLARFKVNQYYFYSEANVETPGFELVNPEARFTREEVRQLIAHARERHMDVVPCLELYGHLHDLFRVEKFAELGLPRYGDEFDPRNPRVLGVLDDFINQTADLFPSAWVHVGFDEPWSLGKIGTTPGQDPFETFIGVLRHVADQAKTRGKRILFWADIKNGASTLSNHPELIRQLPAGAIAAPWDYEAETNYAPYVEPMVAAGFDTILSPAVWNWNEIFPDYHRSFININGLAALARKEKSLGVMNTGWTDCAQTLYRLSLPGLALGGAAAWQSGPVDTNRFFADYAALTYAPGVADKMAGALEDLSTVEEMFENLLHDNTQHVFWHSPLEPGRLERVEKSEPQLRQARLLAESAEERVLAAQKLAPNDPTIQSLLVSARMFDYLGMKWLYALEWAKYFRELKANPDQKLVTLYIGVQMNAQDHGMLADLMDTVGDLRESYRAAWLAESTPYRLGTAMARWDNEQQYWLATWRRVNELLRTWRKGEPFPEFDFIRPRQ
jgi:hypothetical protein